MDLMQKAHKVLGSAKFTPQCQTLRFRDEIYPNVAKRVGFNLEHTNRLPALVLIDLYDDEATLILLQDAENDGVLKDIERDKIVELFDQRIIKHVLTAHIFEDAEYAVFTQAQPKMDKGSFAWFAQDPANKPYFQALGIPYA